MHVRTLRGATTDQTLPKEDGIWRTRDRIRRLCSAHRVQPSEQAPARVLRTQFSCYPPPRESIRPTRSSHAASPSHRTPVLMTPGPRPRAPGAGKLGCWVPVYRSVSLPLAARGQLLVDPESSSHSSLRALCTRRPRRDSPRRSLRSATVLTVLGCQGHCHH